MRIKTMTIKMAALAVLMGAPLAQAANVAFTGFTMDFVDIGDSGNGNDGLSGSAAYGGVDYNYRMGVNEVSEAMINAYNTNSGGPTITKDTRGPDKPATGVSWNEAARFVNWLNASQGYSAAYNVSGGVNTNITLWGSAEAWQQGGENLYRNKDAHYFLPSEDEWYKATYYDPTANSGAGGYWDYATGSDTAPDGLDFSGDTTFDAVFRDSRFAQSEPNDITDTGVLSPYGTLGQSGNVWEWGESAFTASDGSTAAEARVRRGGAWFNPSGGLQSSFRETEDPALENNFTGFRVVAVPEPSSVSLVVIGALGVLLRRKRR